MSAFSCPGVLLLPNRGQCRSFRYGAFFIHSSITAEPYLTSIQMHTLCRS